tara:strand:- start:32 stop:214 length:183 start_codon:yes stop_codon:yes gene_type:complete
MFITNSKDYYVRFYSVEYDEPQFIGPFDSEDAADDYADYQNTGLALSGVPGDVASYSVYY